MGKYKANVRADPRIPAHFLTQTKHNPLTQTNPESSAARQTRDCEERLLVQAAMVKAVNPDTKVFVYRNLVK